MWEVQKVYLVNVRIWVNSTNSKLNNSDQISFVKIQNEPHLVLQKTLRKREVQLSRIGVYIVVIIVSCHTIRIVPNFWEICQTFDRENGKVLPSSASVTTLNFFMTSSCLLHDLNMICLWFVHDLWMTYKWVVYYLFMTCSWLVHDLLMSCIMTYLLLVIDLFMTYHLIMTCSQLPHKLLILFLWLVHVFLPTWFLGAIES